MSTASSPPDVEAGSRTPGARATLPETGDRPPSFHAPRLGWALCLLMVAGFLALRLPYAIWPIELHSDERHYAVGAARMLASGEFLVPRSLTGELRLRKPPLPYWYAAGGFALFGQSALGAKIAWLATAVATLAATWLLARVIGASVAGAAVAVAALAGHATFAKSATQHIPDGPLILGVTVALAAFAALLARDGPRPVALFYAGYGGLAFAALAKGMLPLLLVVVFLAVRLARPLGLSAGERSHERRAAALAGAASLWWFALMGLRFPGEMAAQFLSDQVSDKATFAPEAFLSGLRKTVTDLALPFAPVLAGLFAARRWPALGPRGAPAALLMAWVGAVLLFFAFSDPLWERYVLPAVPAAAALLGLWASRLEAGALGRRLARVVPVFAALPVLAALFAAVIVLRLGHVGVGLALAAAAAGLAALAWRVRRVRRAIPAAALLGASYPLVTLALVPLWLWLARPTPAELLAADLARAGDGPGDVVLLSDKNLVNQVGLVTGGFAVLGYASTPDDLPPEARIVVTNARELAPALAELGYGITLLHGLPRDEFDLGAFLAAWREGALERFREEHGPVLVVARRATADAAVASEGAR